MAEPFRIPEISARPVEVDPTQLLKPRSPALPTGVKSFKDVLTDAVTEVRSLQIEADNTIEKLVAGEIKDVTEAMVAVEKADLAFQTMMALRNRVVAAYEEVMRMQV